MAAEVYGVVINLSDGLPDKDDFQLELVPPKPPGVTVENGDTIKFTVEGIWVIQFGFSDMGRNWLTLNWQHGDLSTSIVPSQVTITHLVENGSSNKYPFSLSYCFEGKTYVFDPTIIDEPPGGAPWSAPAKK